MMIFAQFKYKIKHTCYVLCQIITLASMVFCVSPPPEALAQTATSQLGVPRLVGIPADTSFKALREQVPEANWHISESDKPYPSGGVHERRMFSTNAVRWQEHNFDIYLKRARSNVSTLIAVSDLNQGLEADCQKRSFSILDELSKENGFSVDNWKPEHPRAPYQGVRVWWEIERFRLLGLEPDSRTFVQDAAEGGQTVRVGKTNQGIAIGFPEDPPLNFRRDIGWRSYYSKGQYLVEFITVFGKFDFGLPEKIPSQCKTAIKITNSGNFNVDNTTHVLDITDQNDLKLVGSRGGAYGALLEYDGIKMLLDNFAWNFECDIRSIQSNKRKMAGQLDNCKILDPLGAAIPANLTTPEMKRWAEYAGFFAINKWERDEDDFSKNKAKLKFTLKSTLTIPEFDWDRNLLDDSNNYKNINRMVNISIGPNDYPPNAIRNQLSADIYFDCVVLEDFSPFCGRMRVEPKENAAAFATIWRKFQRDISTIKISPTLEDGTASVGRFFVKRVIFRLPDAELSPAPAVKK